MRRSVPSAVSPASSGVWPMTMICSTCGSSARMRRIFGELVFRYEQRPHFGVAHAEQQVVRLFELDRQRHADRPGVERRPAPRAIHALHPSEPVSPLCPRGECPTAASPAPVSERQLPGLGVGRGFERPVFLLQQECLGPVLLRRSLSNRSMMVFFMVGSRLVHFQNGEECRLRHLHVAYLAHAFLAFLLFFEQLALAR